MATKPLLLCREPHGSGVPAAVREVFPGEAWHSNDATRVVCPVCGAVYDVKLVKVEEVRHGTPGP